MPAHVEKPAGHQNHDQNQRQDNQEVADLHYGSLKVGNTSGACYQFCGASKKRVHSSRSNHCDHFSLFYDRTRVCILTGFLRDRQRFPRERGLVDTDVVALDELTIGGHDVPEIQANDVSGH